MHAYLTHPEWPPLLAAIRATPADDLPRLVAADFLDEIRCGERAELIRVQCEMAQLYRKDRGTTRTLRFEELQRQTKRLTRELFPTFLQPPAAGEPLHRFHLFFDRGFAVKASCPCAWWLERADAICAEGVDLAVHITSAVDWEDWPEGAPAYRLVGREETFGELKSWNAYERLPSMAEALCALTWPSVKSWTVATSRRVARPLVTPPTLAAPGTSPGP